MGYKLSNALAGYLQALQATAFLTQRDPAATITNSRIL
jgi:hypothetical protein